MFSKKSQALSIYNSLSGKKEFFTPILKDHVGMYVCGPINRTCGPISGSFVMHVCEKRSGSCTSRPTSTRRHMIVTMSITKRKGRTTTTTTTNKIVPVTIVGIMIQL